MARTKDIITQSQRLEFIRQELLKTDEVLIETLAQKFNVSGMTIRRDLERLVSNGEVVRTHGGAALAKKLTFEFAFKTRQGKNQYQKQRIATCAAKHIKTGQVIMLDTGTTTLEIAQKLVAMRGITVITTSLAIVSALQFASGIEVILLGGFLRSGSPDMHGPLTEENVEKFRGSVAFMGADAIDAAGNVYTNDLRVASLDGKMARHCDKVIVVADSSKLGKKAMCKIFSQDDYNLIITDKQADKKIIRKFVKNNINIELA